MYLFINLGINDVDALQLKLPLLLQPNHLTLDGNQLSGILPSAWSCWGEASGQLEVSRAKASYASKV